MLKGLGMLQKGPVKKGVVQKGGGSKRGWFKARAGQNGPIGPLKHNEKEEKASKDQNQPHIERAQLPGSCARLHTQRLTLNLTQKSLRASPMFAFSAGQGRKIFLPPPRA